MTSLLAALILATSSQTPTLADTPIPPAGHVEFTAKLEDDAKGYGLVIGDLMGGNLTEWTEPNHPGTLGVGFDFHNPPSRDPFNADGNIYNRPQREVSIHWNNREVANRMIDAEIDPKQSHTVSAHIQPVLGGCEVTVSVNEVKVYDRYFVPEAFMSTHGARVQGDGKVTIDDLVATIPKDVAVFPQRVSVTVFDEALNDKTQHRNKATADFSSVPADVGRVIATLRLDETPAGVDPWDRLAHIYLTDDKGEKFEVLRYITPYDKGWEWKVDVTELLPLFKGKREFEQFCETWAEGWLVSLTLDFYPGKLAERPVSVVNVWNLTKTIGEENGEGSDTLPAASVDVPAGDRVEARIIVTGHGQAPNTNNAAEFISLWRKLKVGGKTFENTLWKIDVYLNPCRPQGGTWKFDRAGWSPGDVVKPWRVDLTGAVTPGSKATFEYEIQPYVNKSPDQGNNARQVIAAQLVVYRKEAK